MSPLAEVRAAMRAVRAPCPVTDILADEEIEQLLGTVIEAMAATGWRLLPPGLSLLSPETVAELTLAARNRGAERLGLIPTDKRTH